MITFNTLNKISNNILCLKDYQVFIKNKIESFDNHNTDFI